MSDRQTVRSKVIESLSLRGMMSRQELQDTLGVSESAVQKVVAGLIHESIVKEGVAIDRKYSTARRYFIFIETSSRSDENPKESDLDTNQTYQDKIVNDIREFLMWKRFRDKLFLESADVIVGMEYDIILILTAPDEDTVALLVKGVIRRHRNIRSTRTIATWTTIVPPTE